MASNVYNDLPGDVRGMVDEYAGPRPPSNLIIAKEVCCEWLCDGMECNCAKRTYGWCCNYKRQIGNVFKWIGIGLLGLIVAAGIVYLWLFPFGTLFEGLMFADVRCGWGLCDNYAIAPNGDPLGTGDYNGLHYTPGPMSTAMAGFGISIIVLGCITGLILLSPCWCWNAPQWYGAWIAVILYIVWVVFITLAFYFNLAKYFGSYNDPECIKFVGLPFVYWVYQLTTSDGYDGSCGYSDCCPFERLGFLGGVQYNPKLPWDVDACTVCKAVGWKYVAVPILAPLFVGAVVALVVVSVRRCKRKIVKIQRKYSRV